MTENKLDRLLELRWDNSIEYLTDDSQNAKEYQSLYSEIQQAIDENQQLKEKLEIYDEICGSPKQLFDYLKKLTDERNEIKRFYEDLLDQWKEQTKNYAKLKEKLEVKDAQISFLSNENKQLNGECKELGELLKASNQEYEELRDKYDK